jgi:hypothetical protein
MLISGRVVYAPVIKTIIHAKMRTTEVLTAVATSELVSFTPHLDKIAVMPANRAERIDAIIHI